MTARQSVPTWSTPIDACRLILRGVTFHTCVRVALFVGTVLTLVNQGSVIAGGNATAVTWVRVGVKLPGAVPRRQRWLPRAVPGSRRRSAGGLRLDWFGRERS